MGLFKKLKHLIKFSDFFYCTEMLRYESQNQFKTLTGGIISLGIIITIMIGFASMIIDTLNLTTITFNIQTIKQVDPTFSTLETTEKGKFMFGLQIWGLNLNDQKRYFDISFASRNTYDGFTPNQTILPLQPCNNTHWAAFPNIVNNFTKLGMESWLCPPMNSIYELQGKYSSELQKRLQISVYPCNNLTNPNKLCASPQQINAFLIENQQHLYFTIYFTNVLINPDQKDYKSYYLQDSSYMLFGNQMGSESYLYFSDYTIITDTSIWPFGNQVSDYGLFVKEKIVNYPYQVAQNNAYCYFFIAKSTDSIIYQRQVQKISSVFSFVGGLIGAASAALFIIKIYTTFSFEISIGLQIFKDEPEANSKQKDEENKDKKDKLGFNFLNFVKFYAYEVLKRVGCRIEQQRIEYLERCRNEILKQLDIKLLINRIIFIEFALTNLFDDCQLEGLQLKKPVTPEQIKHIRQKCNMLQNISEQSIDKAQKSSLSSNMIANIFNFSNRQKDIDKKLQLTQKNHSAFDENCSRQQPILLSRVKNSPKSDIKIEDYECNQKQETSHNFNFGFHTLKKREKQSKRLTYLHQLKKSVENGDKVSKKIWNNLQKFNTNLFEQPN